MRGKEKDAFGLDPSLQDRLKAADQLAKRYQLFSNKVEVDGGQQMIVQFVEDLVDDLDE
jgi:phage terminase small subunit